MFYSEVVLVILQPEEMNKERVIRMNKCRAVSVYNYNQKNEQGKMYE